MHLHMDSAQTSQQVSFDIELSDNFVAEMRVRQYLDDSHGEYYDALDWVTLTESGPQDLLVPVDRAAIGAGGPTILELRLSTLSGTAIENGTHAYVKNYYTKIVGYKTETKVVRICDDKDNYRFGFNGQEKDNEVKGLGNSLDFGARIYDSRLGRFMSLDPLAREFPGWSPYVFAFDNPIQNIDRNGLFGDDARGKFYEQMGTAAIKALQTEGIKNKYKALYVVAQYRNENGFDVTPPNNNPFNIKGSGDAGAVSYMTTEYVKGKPVKMQQSFANFSSVQAGFEGYLDLLERNFPDAYSALTDDTKTMSDFAKGLMNGRLGAYATDPDYETKMTSMLDGVINDYTKDLNSTIGKNNKEISRLERAMKRADAGIQRDYQETINQLETQNSNLEAEIEELGKIQ